MLLFQAHRLPFTETLVQPVELKFYDMNISIFFFFLERLQFIFLCQLLYSQTSLFTIHSSWTAFKLVKIELCATITCASVIVAKFLSTEKAEQIGLGAECLSTVQKVPGLNLCKAFLFLSERNILLVPAVVLRMTFLVDLKIIVFCSIHSFSILKSLWLYFVNRPFHSLKLLVRWENIAHHASCQKLCICVAFWVNHEWQSALWGVVDVCRRQLGVARPSQLWRFRTTSWGSSPCLTLSGLAPSSTTPGPRSGRRWNLLWTQEEVSAQCRHGKIMYCATKCGSWVRWRLTSVLICQITQLEISISTQRNIL